ncbi:MAG: LPS export ABC transporter permease LptG [Alphaproteobacteria bacterium]|nr:LPS export ABC transporter permease LptG [Alphaproteobacteria bacterium]MDE1987592.1 LPS export ABC transporter permease LptG [Alphaproteobacteria bacterium]MDE2162836.1 LPS export ABC transporter permease LptG [Alphaproteobacteria bacterium]MDE2265210.1 LPS export ABC transporter permease LptG [Alphaproteobacteria bacterium]MDE2499235.1 LPS export ABC transporter permease LptG [Alphaproteobacteria bacterium]
MSWSWTLYRYLARQFLLGVAMIFTAFLVLAFSIDIVDLINRTAGRGVGSLVVVGMALLQLPELAQRLLPFCVLLGGVYCFVRLSRSQELVATRAAGVSAWDFLVPPLAVAMAIGVIHVLAVTPISSRMLAQFSALEAKYIKGEASQLSISSNGLWLRQGDRNQQSVIHALTVSDQGVRLDNVIVFLYGPNDQVAGRIDAKSAQLTTGAWLLRNAWVSGPDGRAVHFDRYDLKTTLTPAQIQESFAPPDTLSFWELPHFIRAAQSAGFSAVRYKLYLYALLTLPALFAAMVFMAASFSLKLSRAGGIGRVVLISALSGFGVYFFSEMTTALGRSGILPVALAATAPAAAAILIGMTLVFHQEDG